MKTFSSLMLYLIILIYSVKSSLDDNYIIAIYKIDKPGKYFIINSYSNFYYEFDKIEEPIPKLPYRTELDNTEEIEGCSMYVNGIKEKFSYYKTFEKQGLYEIKFQFNKLLKSTSYMFRDIFQNLIKVDLSHLNTKNLIYMENMFDMCRDLLFVDFSNFFGENVISTKGLFYYCYSIRSIDMSSFKPKQLQTVDYMFEWCKNLKELKIKFNVEKVESFNSMFNNCLKLKKLDLSSFHTNNAKSMEDMFFKCESLTSLDITNFNTSKVINMGLMFSGCKSLSQIRLIILILVK